MLYHRHNLTEELLAEIFNTSQPTISRAINSIEKALQELFSPLALPLNQLAKHPGSLVIDGTLIPTWNWRSLGKSNFSGKHKRAGCNHQVICTVDGKLLVITDPLPGARHDAYAFKKHGLDRYLDETTLADKGYVGLGLLTPTKRTPGVKTSKAVKDNNRVINRVRAVVERVIAQIKTWRIFHTGFRRPLGSYGRVFAVVRGWCFWLREGVLNKPLRMRAKLNGMKYVDFAPVVPSGSYPVVVSSNIASEQQKGGVKDKVVRINVGYSNTQP